MCKCVDMDNYYLFHKDVSEYCTTAISDITRCHYFDISSVLSTKLHKNITHETVCFPFHNYYLIKHKKKQTNYMHMCIRDKN